MSVHTVLTVDEFSKLPEPKEGHIELHHGEVLLVSPPKRGHQRISAKTLSIDHRPDPRCGRNGNGLPSITGL